MNPQDFLLNAAGLRNGMVSQLHLSIFEEKSYATANMADTSIGEFKTIFRLICISMLILLLSYKVLGTEAYMKSVRVEEIPFGLSDDFRARNIKDVGHSDSGRAGIYAVSKLEERRSFFKLFHVPYIVCFFAAKGKWPFIPPFMQNRVDATAKTFFNQNDSYIRQFCQKWIQIKECFRPIFGLTTAVPPEALRSTKCTCANLVANESPMVFFDKDHIGTVSSETILNTIEFLQSFLPSAPTPTKKTKRKNRVRSRLDDIESK